MNKEIGKHLGFVVPSESSHIKPGDLLISSKPFASVLADNLRGQHCDTCYSKRSNLQRCSGCTMAYYCHRECQKEAWTIHKKECSNLKRLKPTYPPDTCRLVARIIFRLQEDGHDYKEELFDRERKFSDLISHEEDIKNDAKKWEHFLTISVCLKLYLGEENIPVLDELIQIFGKVCVNSFTITDKDLNPVGIGLYLAGSIFDHSCVANAYASFVGIKLTICSLIPWTSFKWDKVRLSYVDILNTTNVRQQELKDGYFFNCQCELCRNTKRDKVLSSIMCGNPSCNEPVFIDLTDSNNVVGPCEKCSYSRFDDSVICDYKRIVTFSEKTLAKRNTKKSLSDCKAVLEEQGDLFHPMNYWKVRANEESFEAAIYCKSWSTAIHFGTECLPGIRYHYGEKHPVYGMTLLKLAKIELYNFSFRNALKHLELVEPIIKASHGSSSPLYRDDVAPLLKQAQEEINMVQNCGFDVSRR